MHHGHGHRRLVQYVLGHAAWTRTHCMYRYMQHGHGHTIDKVIYIQHVLVCPCCISMDMNMDMLHFQVHFVSIFMLHVRSILHVKIHAASQRRCCMSMLMLLVHFHAACSCKCRMSKSMLHVLVHAEQGNGLWH
jgi:hypothetical protein